MKTIALAAILWAASPFGFGAQAFAQDETSDPMAPKDEAEGEKKPEQPREAGRKGAPFPRIADEEETIYAVQQKAYLINQKFEITPMGGIAFTDRFVLTIAVGGSLGYHIAENFALELSGAYMFPDESALTTEILEEGKLTPEIAKLTQLLWNVNLGFQWSPVYGKLQIFGLSLGTFQFYLGAGGGVGQSRVQCTPGMNLDPNRGFNPDVCPMIENVTTDEVQFVYEPATLRFVGHLSGGFRFFFNEFIGLKIEVKDLLFVSRVFRPDTTEATQRFTDAVRNNIFLQLGISFLLGGE
jgi:outer membrane beta-barrel protein